MAHTLIQLAEMMREREAELKSLLSERDKIDKRIALIRGEQVSHKTNGKPKAKKNGQPRKGSLRDVVGDVLKSETEGITLDRLEELVKATGYKTKSKKFQNTLYQAIHKSEDIAYDKKTKTYKL